MVYVKFALTFLEFTSVNGMSSYLNPDRRGRALCLSLSLFQLGTVIVKLFLNIRCPSILN